jgi:hypothetical protein
MPVFPSPAPAVNHKIPWIRGAFRHVLHPPGQQEAQRRDPRSRWYINDHCFIVDEANRIHWFGITNPFPASGSFYGPGTHRNIGHASANAPNGPWTEHPHAISIPETSKVVVASCFVVRHGDEYVMLYDSDVRGPGLYLARSKDLSNWTTVDDLPPIVAAHATRDPCIIKIEDGRYLLYVTGGSTGAGRIYVGTSTDLAHWTWGEPALLADDSVRAGRMESPFVHCHEGVYYLFVNYSHRQYEETIVFASADPTRFDWQQPLSTLFGHASEVLSWNGMTYITHCGLEDQHWSEIGAPYGLWLADLGWAPQGDPGGR